MPALTLMDKDTAKFLRNLVLDNMENQLDCGLDMHKPDEAHELKDYMTKCLLALVAIQRLEQN